MVNDRMAMSLPSLTVELERIRVDRRLAMSGGTVGRPAPGSNGVSTALTRCLLGERGAGRPGGGGVGCVLGRPAALRAASSPTSDLGRSDLIGRPTSNQVRALLLVAAGALGL